MSDLRFFASLRRRFAARVGLVARRAADVRRAEPSRSASRERAISRFRACERVSAAEARTVGPSRVRIRSRWRGPRTLDRSASKITSTRVSDVLACCPPGPPDLEALQVNSLSGMTNDDVTRKPAAMRTTLRDTVPDGRGFGGRTRTERCRGNHESTQGATSAECRNRSCPPCRRVQWWR